MNRFTSNQLHLFPFTFAPIFIFIELTNNESYEKTPIQPGHFRVAVNTVYWLCCDSLLYAFIANPL